MEILGCEQCQIVEDGEIEWGIGKPVLFSDTNLFEACCPNCRADLNDWNFVLINIPWVAQQPEKYQTAKTGGF